MKLSWEHAETFLAVIEHHSFSAAGKALRVGQPTISRRIQHLEALLEQSLFVRGKHGAQATTAALQLVPAARQMAQWAAEFNRAAMQVEQKIAGVVKIAAPPGIAVELLAPFAAALRAIEPDIRLDVLASIDYIDLIRGGADFAIRTTPPTETGLVVLHRITVQAKVVASASYARSLPNNCQLADIDWVSWSEPYQQVAPRPMLEKAISNFQPVFCSDDYLVLKAAVKQGLGAMIIGQTMGHKKLESGLEEIKLDTQITESAFYIVAAKSMQYVTRVNRVVELLLEYLDN